MPASKSPITTDSMPAGAPRWVLAARPALAAVVLFAMSLSVFEIHNDDAGFHTATGRWIRATGEVPDRNPFSYAEDGHRWIQHQWIPAVVISWVVDRFGPRGLILAKTAFVGVMVGVAAVFCGGFGAPGPWPATMLAICVAAGAFRFKERPLLISVLALIVVVGLLLRWRERKLAGHRIALVAALVPAVAIQLHAGGLYGLLAWGALVGATSLRWLVGDRFRRVRPATGEQVRRVCAWALASLILTATGLLLLAPAGLEVLRMPFSFGADRYWHAHLAEFRSLPWAGRAHLQWYAVALAAGGALLGVAVGRLYPTFLLLGFAYLGVRHQRLVLPMAMAAAPAVSSLLGHTRLRARLSSPGMRTLASLLLGAILVAGAIDQARWQRMGLGEGGLDRRRHPIELIDAGRDLPPEVFVSDGLAGLWLWRNFDPKEPLKHRILVHNCLECYDESTYIDVYQKIRYGLPGWRREVERLGIRSFLIKHTSTGERRFERGRPNVRQRLFADPAWTLIDFDDVAALWVRSDALPGGVDALPRFPVDPDTGLPAPGATWPEVRNALRRQARRRPRTVRPLLILAHRAAAAGDAGVLVEAVQGALRRRPEPRVTAELTMVMRRFARRAGPSYFRTP